jgi:anti-sigma B factor antagonist
MDLTYHDDRGVAVVEILGALNGSCGAELKQLCERLWAEGRRQFVIDLKAVDFIDSIGLSMLVRCFKWIRGATGRISLTTLQPSIRRIFELTRLDRSFDIYADVSEAVQNFTGKQE